jgi:uncharacterized RDD family membrane protein YckC
MKHLRLLPALLALSIGATALDAGAQEFQPRGNGDAVISFAHDASLEAGRHAEAVVAILGSATSAGEVDEGVVSVLGDTRVTGPVGDAAVAVGGDVYVNSKVQGDVVAVLGNVQLGPQADVGGDVVVVGGTLDRDAAALVGGDTKQVAIGVFGSTESLRRWFRECLVLGRPLAFTTGIGWAWGVAAAFLLLYMLLALAFRDAVDHCAEVFEARPGRSVVAALLTMVLTPVGMALVAVTIIGIALVPFLGLALACIGLFGKAVMLALIGRRFTRLAGNSVFAHTAFAVLIGGLVVTLLYTVPIVGFIVYKLLGILGHGVVVYTLLLLAGARSRERRAEHAGAVPAAAAASTAPLAASSAEGNEAATPTGSADPVEPTIATTLPRAGFWIRMGALAIDAVLVGLLFAFLPRHAHSLWLVLFAAYGVVMWKLRSTTVGGIICHLQVVRTDGRPIDWGTAVVRGLGCFLSLFAVGLGFIWIAIDEQHQSWHDKIAGTVVVRTARGLPLV